MGNTVVMRSLAVALAIAAVVLAAPAGAQTNPPYPTVLTPPPLPAKTPGPAHSAHPAAKATPFMTFSNPAGKGPVNSTACSRTAMSAQQQHTNPITGQPQAATLVSVPVTKGGGSVKSATSAQQMADACAHSGH